MAGSVVVACKRALVDGLTGQPGMSGGTFLQVTYGWPGDDLAERECIFMGRARADQPTAALGAGRRRRTDDGTFEVIVRVLVNGTPEQAEERALEIGTEVEEWVADHKTLGGVTGLNWAVVDGWELNNATAETGSLAELIYTIRYQARLT